MKTRKFTTSGSLHPILFFAVVYVVALLASVFICSSLFYSCNANKTSITGQEKTIPFEPTKNTAATVAIR